MEKRLPLDDVKAFNEAVSGIASSELKQRADFNGSNILGKKIRQTALQPFNFLLEDPKGYNTKRPLITLAQAEQSATIWNATSDNGGSERSKRRRLDLGSDSWSQSVSSENAIQAPGACTSTTDLPVSKDTDAGLHILVAAADLQESENGRSQLCLEGVATQFTLESTYSRRSMPMADGIFSNNRSSALPLDEITSGLVGTELHTWQSSQNLPRSGQECRRGNNEYEAPSTAQDFPFMPRGSFANDRVEDDEPQTCRDGK